MKNFLLVAVGALFGVTLVGLFVIFSGQKNSNSITILPTETPTPLVVYINGDVKEPGVYRLLPGSRIVDLVKVAGGFLDGANYEKFNLAAILVDGQQINIGSENGAAPTPMLVIGDSGLKSSLLSPDFQPTNLNTASADDLISLPGIGPTLAQRIIDFREQYGDFSSVDDLTLVQGISSTLIEEVRAYLTVE